MRDKTQLELSDALCECDLALQEARYIARTVHKTFCPVWAESNDARKGADFVHEMTIAMGMVCERMNDAVKHLESALKMVNT